MGLNHRRLGWMYYGRSNAPELVVSPDAADCSLDWDSLGRNEQMKMRRILRETVERAYTHYVITSSVKTPDGYVRLEYPFEFRTEEDAWDYARYMPSFQKWWDKVTNKDQKRSYSVSSRKRQGSIDHEYPKTKPKEKH